jgi:FAD/FMN-containing dehydrogenase
MRFADVLALEGARLGRNNTIVAITPSAELEYVKVLREMKRRGMRVIAVIVDANTFGGRAETERAAVELIASGVPTYVVKEGDDLQAVLGQ